MAGKVSPCVVWGKSYVKVAVVWGGGITTLDWIPERSSHLVLCLGMRLCEQKAQVRGSNLTASPTVELPRAPTKKSYHLFVSAVCNLYMDGGDLNEKHFVVVIWTA